MIDPENNKTPQPVVKPDHGFARFGSRILMECICGETRETIKEIQSHIKEMSQNQVLVMSNGTAVPDIIVMLKLFNLFKWMAKF